jgi:aminopeptidase N
MNGSSPTLRRLVIAAITLLATLPAAATAVARPHHHVGSPGAPSIGDPLFPGLGNGGYDTRHVTLNLRYPTAAPLQTVQGFAVITARATQDLSQFNLDFAGDSVGRVSVNGRRAESAWEGEELVITPRRSIRDHRRFTVAVPFTASTTPEDPTTLITAWFATPSGSFTAFQPNYAHTKFPINDHPSDKASYTLRFDVPAGTTAVGNGLPTDRRTVRGQTITTYEERDPMAAELVSLNAGELTVVNRGRIDGITFRDVMPTKFVDALEPANALGPAHMEWMEQHVGRYPFDSYGTLSADSNAGFALENQTLSLYPAWFLIDAPPATYEPVMVHELAHQWFGDSVAPYRWRDVWLNEGHATWYEQLYGAEKYPEAYNFEDNLRAYYSQGDIWRAQYGPVASPNSAVNILDLFNPNVYQGGATVLYALRQVVGEDAFYAIERRWVRRYEGDSASTEDFIALASRVAHRDLGPFLRDWLYGSKTPPMPGHPDWTVTAPGAAPAAPKARTAPTTAASLEQLAKR